MATKIEIVGLTSDVDEETLMDLLENKKRMQCEISTIDVTFNRDRGAALVTLDHAKSKCQEDSLFGCGLTVKFMFHLIL